MSFKTLLINIFLKEFSFSLGLKKKINVNTYDLVCGIYAPELGGIKNQSSSWTTLNTNKVNSYTFGKIANSSYKYNNVTYKIIEGYQKTIGDTRYALYLGCQPYQ